MAGENRLRQGSQGFTLVEVMVALGVAMVGLLAVMQVVEYSKRASKGVQTKSEWDRIESTAASLLSDSDRCSRSLAAGMGLGVNPIEILCPQPAPPNNFMNIPAIQFQMSPAPSPTPGWVSGPDVRVLIQQRELIDQPGVVVAPGAVANGMMVSQIRVEELRCAPPIATGRFVMRAQRMVPPGGNMSSQGIGAGFYETSPKLQMTFYFPPGPPTGPNGGYLVTGCRVSRSDNSNAVPGCESLGLMENSVFKQLQCREEDANACRDPATQQVVPRCVTINNQPLKLFIKNRIVK